MRHLTDWPYENGDVFHFTQCHFAAVNHQERERSGQVTLFGAFSDIIEKPEFKIPQVGEWPGRVARQI